METNYRMCWSLHGKSCNPINFKALSDKDAKEIVKEVMARQKGLGLEKSTKIVGLYEVGEGKKEGKNILT